MKTIALQNFCQLHLDSEDVDVIDKLGALQEYISANPEGFLLKRLASFCFEDDLTDTIIQ